MAIRRVTLSRRAYVMVPPKQWKALVGGGSVRGAAASQRILPPRDGSYTNQDVRVSLANKMAARRKAAGMTQQQLAKRAGVRVETISRLENAMHMPGARTFEKLERAFKNRANKPFAA
jgi:DNA-binding XRE family transcriptional regulator